MWWQWVSDFFPLPRSSCLVSLWFPCMLMFPSIPCYITCVVLYFLSFMVVFFWCKGQFSFHLLMILILVFSSYTPLLSTCFQCLELIMLKSHFFCLFTLADVSLLSFSCYRVFCPVYSFCLPLLKFAQLPSVPLLGVNSGSPVLLFTWAAMEYDCPFPFLPVPCPASAL